MNHIVVFKFEENFMDAALVDNAKKVFQQLKRELPQDVLQVGVYENIVERDTNYDLLVSMELAKRDSLDKYLNHPIHVALVKDWIPHISSRASLDYDM